VKGFPPRLHVLAVDDEPPALDELVYLLRADHRVSTVDTAADAASALRVLRDSDIDAVFLDIRMPGLDGMELARVLRRFAKPPAIVFVTAYDDRAVDAFELGVTDYVRKPVQGERLRESLRRVIESLRANDQSPGAAGPAATEPAAAEPAITVPPTTVPATTAPAAGPNGSGAAGSAPTVSGSAATAPGSDGAEDGPDVAVPVELAGVVRMVPRSSVRWVEARGDYARLHTATGSHLVRVPLATLAERWAEAGFVRIHRSYLVRLRLITELRLTDGGYVVVVDGRPLPVSRRHTRELKDRLVRAAKQNWS
jgi:DNA-binding LytR/AlgR family response regulator